MEGGGGGGSRFQLTQSKAQSQFGVSPAAEINTVEAIAIGDCQQVEVASPISSRPPAASSLNYEELMRLSNTSGQNPMMGVDEDALTGAGEEGERSGGGIGNRWPRQETLALLKIRSDMDAAFRDATLKGPLWEEISRKLGELGYGRSGKKCKEKFENVQKYYKRTKEGRGGRQDGKTYKFFSQLEALHGSSSSNSSTMPGNNNPIPIPIPIPNPNPNPSSSNVATTTTVGISFPHITTTTTQLVTPISVGIGITNTNTNINPIPISSVSHSQTPMGIFSSSPPHQNPDHFTVRVGPTVSDTIPTAQPPKPQMVGVSFSSDSDTPSSSTGSEDNNEEESDMEGEAGPDPNPNPDPNNPSSRNRKRRRGCWLSSSSKLGGISGSGGSRSSRRRHKMMMEFFENLMKQVMHKQEIMQERFLEAIEKREQDRMIREENWKREELARLSREQQRMAQDRAVTASRDSAIIAFLQKFTGQTIQLPQTTTTTVINISSPHHHPTPPPHDMPVQPDHPQPHPQPQPQPVLSASAVPQPSNALAMVSFEPYMGMGDMGSSDHHHHHQGIGSSSSSRWPKSEVLALIKLRSGLDSRYQEMGPKGPLWEEISTGMQRMGYSRSSKRCKEKWENINKYFKKVKESDKKRRQDSKTCPYFAELDALYRNKYTKLDHHHDHDHDQHQQNILHLSSTSSTLALSHHQIQTTCRPQNFSPTATLFGEAATTTQKQEEEEEEEAKTTKPEDIVNEFIVLHDRDVYDHREQNGRSKLSVVNNGPVTVTVTGTRNNEDDEDDDDENDEDDEESSDEDVVDYNKLETTTFQNQRRNKNVGSDQFPASMAVVQSN